LDPEGVKTQTIKLKSTTYSTEAGGSRGAGRSGITGLAGVTIVTSRTRHTLQSGGREKERTREGVRLWIQNRG